MPCLPHFLFRLSVFALMATCALPVLSGQSPRGASAQDPLVYVPELMDPLNPESSGRRALPVPVPQGRSAGGHAVGAEVVDEGPVPQAPYVPQDPLSVGAEIVDDFRPPAVSRVIIPPSGPVEREQTQVSVLGYHDFSSTKPRTRMRMTPSDFRSEMQRIKDSGATVISMDDFIAWKKGEKKLPARCVLITLDDGWKAVYTDAFPLLKEFGYPFTIFLYTDYINKGGNSLTLQMIQEMVAYGATVGSHSKSHPYPKDFRKNKAGGEARYLDFLTLQMAESKRILEETLGVKVNTYCYPGGYRTHEMYDVLAKAGYLFGFDVISGKVTVATNDMIIPRYMVIGTELFTFDGALRYGSAVKGSDPLAESSAGTGTSAAGPVPRQVVTPRANSLQPLNGGQISINMATVGDFDPNSITMRVSGMGKVPGFYESQTKTYVWKPNRPLRGRVHVSVSWTLPQSKAFVPPVEWVFDVTEFSVEPPPMGWIP